MVDVTQEEIEAAAATLRALNKGTGRLPAEIFYALMPQVVSAPIELGVFRRKSSRLEILLTQRPADDPHFTPNGWHMPGVVMIVTDMSEKDALKRLISTELEHSFLIAPRRVGQFFVNAELCPVRPAQSALYVAKVQDYTGKGTFFPVRDLPENTLAHHVVLLQEMLRLLPVSF